MNSHIIVYYDRLIAQCETFGLADLAVALTTKRDALGRPGEPVQGRTP